MPRRRPKDVLEQIEFEVNRIKEGAHTTELLPVLRKARRVIVAQREELAAAGQRASELKRETKWMRKILGWKDVREHRLEQQVVERAVEAVNADGMDDWDDKVHELGRSVAALLEIRDGDEERGVESSPP